MKGDILDKEIVENGEEGFRKRRRKWIGGKDGNVKRKKMMRDEDKIVVKRIMRIGLKKIDD